MKGGPARGAEIIRLNGSGALEAFPAYRIPGDAGERVIAYPAGIGKNKVEKAGPNFGQGERRQRLSQPSTREDSPPKNTVYNSAALGEGSGAIRFARSHEVPGLAGR